MAQDGDEARAVLQELARPSAQSARPAVAAVVVVDSVNRKPTDNPPGVAEALPPEKPEFEAAEIKPSPPGTQGVGIQYTQGGRINARGTLRDLIGMANEILPNTEEFHWPCR